MGIEARRKRVREFKRQAILKAARRLFFEKGFKHVTVESIAKRADISKGAVYLHFKSKEEIYTQILFNDTERHYKLMSVIAQKEGTINDRILELTASYADFFLNDRELFRILMNYMLHTDHMNLPEEVDRQIINAVNRNIDMIGDAFRQGIANGEFPAAMNVFESRNAVWGLLNGIISLHLFTGPESRREGRIRSTVEHSTKIYLQGLKAAYQSGNLLTGAKKGQKEPALAGSDQDV